MDITVDAYGTATLPDGTNIPIGQVHILNDEIISLTLSDFAKEVGYYPLTHRRKYKLTILDQHHRDIDNAAQFARLTYMGQVGKDDKLFIRVDSLLRFRLKWAHGLTWTQRKHELLITSLLSIIAILSAIWVQIDNANDSEKLERTMLKTDSIESKQDEQLSRLSTLDYKVYRIDTLFDSLTNRIDRLDSNTNNSTNK